jgi:hypothetical protein
MKAVLVMVFIFFVSGCTVREVVQPSGPSSYEQNQKADKAWKDIK